MWTRCLALLVLLLGGEAVASPVLPQEPRLEVVELRFEGNRHFSDRALSNAIITRASECRSFLLTVFCWGGASFSRRPAYLYRPEFRRDVARIRLFYYQRGYREAAVDTLLSYPAEGQVAITFRITEGRPVRVDSVAVVGMEAAPGVPLPEELPVRPGDPLSSLALDAARDTLLVRLMDRGYPRADVLRSYFVPRNAPYSARVTFQVLPGPRARFGPVEVLDNERVPATVIRRMLPFREGDPYSRARQYEGQRNLYNLEIFRFVQLTPDLGYEPDSIVPVTVRVSEGDLHRVRSGAGMNTADCMNAEARWVSRNFVGGARRLQLRGRVSNLFAPAFQSTLCPDAGTHEYGQLNWTLSVDFNQPWLFSSRNSFTAGLYGERQSVKDLFVREALGVNLAFVRMLGRASPLALFYRPQIQALDAAELFFCSSYLVCAPEDIAILQGSNWLAPVGLSFSRDRTDRSLDPTRGYLLFLETEFAARWTGSDFEYTRVLGEVSAYRRGDSGWILAGRVRGGRVFPRVFEGLVGGDAAGPEVVHPQKRFFAGGANSVRGFAQNRLGPRVLQVRDVQDLLYRAGEAGPCTVQSVLDLSCDAGSLTEGELLPRPTGGTALLEGSVELRFPLWRRTLQGAAFVDVGQVWGEGERPALRDLAVTPGLGIRYMTPIGPFRVDVAYRGRASRRLQVVTARIRPFDPARDREAARLLGPDGTPIPYVRSQELGVLGPRVLWGDAPRWSLRRFQIHFSIGQAF